MSPDQVQALANQALNGGLSQDQLQQMTARLGAMNVTAGDAASIGHALGLSDQQVSQLSQTLQASRQSQAPNQMPAGPAAPSASSPVTNVALTPPSAIESRFLQLGNPNQQAATPTINNVSQFGYNFLTAGVSTFAPVQNVPVGDDYMLGPGDQLILVLWGRVNSTVQYTVDRDGSIHIDQVGPLQVAGLTFGQAKKLVEGRLKQSRGLEAQLTMGQLRTIQVFVVGEVNQPGVYTVSSLSHVSNALVAAGGVAKTGSLRQVKIRRGNSVQKVLDLYQFLLLGDNSADERLRNDDVIFVPVIGPVVGVVGDVKRPAIFEYAPEFESLGAVVDTLSGGVTAFGFTERLQVERVENHKQMVVLDMPLTKLRSQEFKVRDGDLVKIMPVLSLHTNSVVLSGNVSRPGEFQWRKNMRVSELIAEGQGVLPHTYFKYALIKRLEGSQKYTHFVQVNLAAALAGDRKADLYLMPHDELDVYSLDALRETPAVTVSGQVRTPGQYLLSERMKVSDLIYLAGGLKEGAYTGRAALVRTNIVGGKAQRASEDIDLASILNGTSRQDVVLKANDEVFIWQVLGWQLPQRTVLASGEVLNPGSFHYNDGMRVRDLLSMTGGFKDDAYREKVQLARTEVIEGAKTIRTMRDLDLRTGSAELELALRWDDQLYVTTAPNWHLPWVVMVKGEVVRPGQYVIHDQETLSAVMTRTGGYRTNAFPKGLVFIRASIKQVEQERLEEARTRISQEVLQLSTALPLLNTRTTSNSSSGSEMSATFASLQQLLATTQGQQADGRLVIRADKIFVPSSQQDVLMEDGDTIAVPRRPSAVYVLGQVYHPTAVVARRGLTLKDYLYEAGGATQQGDVDRVILVRADGAMVTQDSLKNSGNGSIFPALTFIGDGIMGEYVEAGDTIYVPESLANVQGMVKRKYWTDVTTIMANSATALAVVGLLATRL
ncbi:MAG: SLBB domain-containing protein [Candidatus Binatus sp.]|uniref:polysaccharide biosynthesis/export family protein n=1 Tax=Candidatus Binatus sp. TaxID=2811406 RepID=UPI00271B5DE0|nr:SLBB domain-containing protein [Candidatus Binatus sp.]MDO8435057.1 SLBB domain-containing protein [Candidatus Binatus sp.]